MKHEITDACAPWHCSMHDEDESGNGSVCMECGHLYPTRWHIWWGYLRRFYPIVWSDRPSQPPWRRPFRPDEDLLIPVEAGRVYAVHLFMEGFKPPTWRGWAWDLIRVPFKLPSHIYSCPECSHDF